MSERLPHQVPQELEKLLEQQGIGNKEQTFCVCSYLTRSSEFGKTWLAIGDKKISVIRNTDGYEVTSKFELEKLTGARTLAFIGGGALTLDVDGKPTEVLRFPASQARLFGAIWRVYDCSRAPRRKNRRSQRSRKTKRKKQKPLKRPKKKRSLEEKVEEKPKTIAETAMMSR